MSRVIGGILALAAFISVVAASAIKGLGVWDSIVRGAIASVLLGLVGWLVFGPIGLDLAKESVAGAETPPAKAPEPAPPPTPPKT